VEGQRGADAPSAPQPSATPARCSQGAREVAVGEEGQQAQALGGGQQPALLQLGQGQALLLGQAQQPALLKLGQQLKLLDAAVGAAAKAWRLSLGAAGLRGWHARPLAGLLCKAGSRRIKRSRPPRT
jgi:hypothetical protein